MYIFFNGIKAYVSAQNCSMMHRCRGIIKNKRTEKKRHIEQEEEQ